MNDRPGSTMRSIGTTYVRWVRTDDSGHQWSVAARPGRMALALLVGHREQVAFAKIGTAPPLQLLVVAAERVLLRQVADDRAVGGRGQNRQGLHLLVLEPCQRRADVLVGQQEHVLFRREI